MSWNAGPSSLPPHCLRGARILIIEDEPLIALDLRALLEDEGAKVVGPCRNLAAGLRVARRSTLTAAVLDVRIGREWATPIAQVLRDRGVPFAFYTGQVESDALRGDWPEAPVIAKPSPARQLVAVVEGLCGKARSPDGFPAPRRRRHRLRPATPSP